MQETIQAGLDCHPRERGDPVFNRFCPVALDARVRGHDTRNACSIAGTAQPGHKHRPGRDPANLAW